MQHLARLQQVGRPSTSWGLSPAAGPYGVDRIAEWDVTWRSPLTGGCDTSDESDENDESPADDSFGRCGDSFGRLCRGYLSVWGGQSPGWQDPLRPEMPSMRPACAGTEPSNLRFG
jgi:hypothetical protein